LETHIMCLLVPLLFQKMWHYSSQE